MVNKRYFLLCVIFSSRLLFFRSLLIGVCWNRFFFLIFCIFNDCDFLRTVYVENLYAYMKQISFAFFFLYFNCEKLQSILAKSNIIQCMVNESCAQYGTKFSRKNNSKNCEKCIWEFFLLFMRHDVGMARISLW